MNDLESLLSQPFVSSSSPRGEASIFATPWDFSISLFREHRKASLWMLSSCCRAFLSGKDGMVTCDRCGVILPVRTSTTAYAIWPRRRSVLQEWLEATVGPLATVLYLDQLVEELETYWRELFVSSPSGEASLKHGKNGSRRALSA